jgi:tricorn protease-like protein
MPSRGGEPRRLTFLFGATLAQTIGWSEDGSECFLRQPHYLV